MSPLSDKIVEFSFSCEKLAKPSYEKRKLTRRGINKGLIFYTFRRVNLYNIQLKKSCKVASNGEDRNGNDIILSRPTVNLIITTEMIKPESKY